MAHHPKERCVAQGQKKLKRVAVGSAVTLALALIIAVLTLAPLPAACPAGSDKVYHILAFAGLAFPLPLVRPRLTIWVVLGVIAYGGAIEMIQPFFGRQAEWADLLADGVGAVVGAVAGYALSRNLSRFGPLSMGKAGGPGKAVLNSPQDSRVAQFGPRWRS